MGLRVMRGTTYETKKGGVKRRDLPKGLFEGVVPFGAVPEVLNQFSFIGLRYCLRSIVNT